MLIVTERRTRTLPVAAWLIVGCGALGLFRQSEAPVWDSLWAEDALFLSETAGPFAPYRGYFHVVPRLLAVIVQVFPLAVWPWIVSLLVAGVVAGVGVFVYYAAERLPDRSRLLLAVWVVVPPVAAVTGSMANLHWFLLVGAFWAVFAPQRLDRWGLLITAAAALSNPATVLVGVMAGVKRRWALAGVAVVGASLHLLAGDMAGEIGGTVEQGVVYWMRSALVVFGGDRLSMWVMVVAPLLVIVAAVAVVWAVQDDRSVFGWSALGLSVVLCVLGAVARGQTYDVVWLFGNIRVVFVPAALMLGVVLAWRRWQTVIAVLVVASIVVGFSVDTRSSAPRWRVQDCPRVVAPNGDWVVDC